MVNMGVTWEAIELAAVIASSLLLITIGICKKERESCDYIIRKKYYTMKEK